MMKRCVTDRILAVITLTIVCCLLLAACNKSPSDGNASSMDGLLQSGDADNVVSDDIFGDAEDETTTMTADATTAGTTTSSSAATTTATVGDTVASAITSTASSTSSTTAAPPLATQATDDEEDWAVGVIPTRD